jgi:hypothetical protein
LSLRPAARRLHQGESREAGASRARLTDEEQKEFEKCDAVIKGGWTTFLEVGRALYAIKKANLHRGQYESFDEYCRECFQYGRNYAYRLIDAASVVDVLTIVNTTLPKNEAQVRPLVGLKPDHARTAWVKAVASANGDPVTARLVKQEAAKFVKTKPDGFPRKQPGNRKGSKRKAALKEALRLLDKIQDAVRELKGAELTLELLNQARNCLLELHDAGVEVTQDKAGSPWQEKAAA